MNKQSDIGPDWAILRRLPKYSRAVRENVKWNLMVVRQLKFLGRVELTVGSFGTFAS